MTRNCLPMNMPQPHDALFLLHRYQRMKNSPNNWLLWIALFSAMNGFFMQSSQKIVLSAALVMPEMLAGALPHFVAAALLAGLALAGRSKWPVLTYIGLGIYAVDTLYVIIHGMQSALLMHGIVLGFVGFTIWRTRILARQLAALPPIPDPFPK
jgi:hypothetical protein